MNAGIPAKRTLYLLPSSRVHVTARGPALAVSGSGISPAVVPIQRIRRITCNTRVDWSGDALALCLGEGITITIGDGARGLGGVAPFVSSRSTLHSEVELFCERPDWAVRIDNWCRSRRQWVARSVAHSTPSRAGTSAAERAALAKDFVHLGVLRAEPPAFAYPWCMALVAEELARSELASHYPAGRSEKLDLVGTVTFLSWAALALGITEPVRRINDMRTWVTIFEAWAHEGRGWANAHLISFSSLARRSGHLWL